MGDLFRVCERVGVHVLFDQMFRRPKTREWVRSEPRKVSCQEKDGKEERVASFDFDIVCFVGMRDVSVRVLQGRGYWICSLATGKAA